jgi:hypothetical protein
VEEVECMQGSVSVTTATPLEYIYMKTHLQPKSGYHRTRLFFFGCGAW